MQTVGLLVFFLSFPALALGGDRRERGGERRASGAIDVRQDARAPARPRARAAQRGLRRRLGRGALVRIDRGTGTPRLVTDLGGALTARSRKPPRAIVLDFLRDQRQAFALDRGDLDRLAVEREYRSRDGVSHVRLRQSYRGLPALDGGTTAAVRDGRLLSLAGAPQPALDLPSIIPRLSAGEALGRALRAVRSPKPVSLVRAKSGVRRESQFRGGHGAGLVVFGEPRRARLAWALLVFADSQHVYRTVLDAHTGATLRRANLVNQASTGRALDNNPAEPLGSTPQDKPFGTYIDSGNDRLRGDSAWTYSDQDDDVYTALDVNGEPAPLPSSANEVPPSSGSGTGAAAWTYPQAVDPAPGAPGRACPASGCTWNAFGPVVGSVFTLGDNWQKNRAQAATQAHYLVSRFHDHLLSAPISFDEASGNFEEDNASGQGLESDPVHTQVDDGANVVAGLPDAAHTNNANMLTLPDGRSPIMQMFLFTGRDPGADNDVNGADDAQVVLHEYTHGLTNRLVCCDAGGFGQLSSEQSGAMGEAWSDWYMFDYLNAAGFQADTGAPGELDQGEYEAARFVTEATDCPVTGTSANCPRGGYTYADYGKISGFGPEIHADGEIWAQTLWDLRTRLSAAHPGDGVLRARRLVTGGLRLSPGEPDFLDMRDAILAADSALQGGADSRLIRDVFAARGMGACAASDGGNDTTPTADFRVNTPAGGCSGTPPAPPTGPPAPPTGPQTPAVTPPKLLSDIGFGGFPRRASLRRVLRRGLSGRISCDVGCSFRASLVLPRRSARRAGLRGRTVVVSRTRGAVSTGGASRKVRFKFKRSVARRLRRLTRGTALEVRVGAVDPRGTGRTEKKKLTLKR